MISKAGETSFSKKKLGDEVVAGEDELWDGEDALFEERGGGARGRHPLHRALVEPEDALLHLHRRRLSPASPFSRRGAGTSVLPASFSSRRENPGEKKTDRRDD